MSKAMQSIVDTYVALNRPEALQELQAHRLKLIGSERSGFDLFRQQIEDELAIIRGGLVKLTAPLILPQPKPDEPRPRSAAATAEQQIVAQSELNPSPVMPLAAKSDSVESVPDKPSRWPYGFPASTIATPILAAAVLSKSGPTNDPARAAIRLQLDLAKRSFLP